MAGKTPDFVQHQFDGDFARASKRTTRSTETMLYYRSSQSVLSVLIYYFVKKKKFKRWRQFGWLLVLLLPLQTLSSSSHRPSTALFRIRIEMCNTFICGVKIQFIADAIAD